MRKELSQKAATVHAQAAMEKIESLTCPAERKTALIDAIKHIHQNEDGA